MKLEDILAMREVDDETWIARLECLKQLKQANKKPHPRDEDRIARYAYISDASHEVQLCTGPCHSALNRGGGITTIATSPNLDDWKDPDKWSCDRHGGQVKLGAEWSYKKFVAWWEFLVNDSPWASCFITKDLDEAGEMGVLIDVDQPANWVMAAIIATRHPHEYPQRVMAWYDAVQAGGDPLALMPLVENTAVVVHGRTKCLELVGAGDIHDVFDMYGWSKLTFSNFMHGKPVHCNDTFREGARYDGVHGMFGSTRVDYPHRVPDKPLGPGWMSTRFNGKLFPNDREVMVETYTFPEGNKKVKKGVTSYRSGIKHLAEIIQQLRKDVHA